MYTRCPARLAIKFTRHSTLFSLVLVVVAILHSVTCSHAVDAPAKTGAGRTVRVGVYETKPLAYSDKDGSARGFFVDMLNHIAEKERWNVRYLPGTWQEGLDRLKNDKIDLVLCIGYTTEREKYMDFPKEYLFLDWGLIFKAKGSRITSLLDLEGKSVSALKGDVYLTGFKELIRQFNINVKLLELDQYPDVFKALETGAVAAAVNGNLYSMLDETGRKLEQTPIIFTPVKLGYAANKGKNGDLISALDRNIAEMKTDRASIYHRELVHLMGKKGATIPKEAYWVVFGIAAALFFAITWNVLLKRRVKANTEHLELEIAERKHTEEALKRSEYFFKESQRSASIGSYHADFVAGKWVSSEVLDTIFGIDENYGRSIQGWLDIVHPDDRDLMDRYLIEEVISNRKPFSMEYRILRQNDGETRWVNGRGSAEFDSDGHMLNLIGTIQDITERKLAEQQLQETQAILQAAMDCSPAGIAIADAPDGRLRYVNDAGLLIRGSNRQSVVNGVGVDNYVASWKILNLDGRPLNTDEVPLARAILFGESNSREFIIRRKEGEDRIVFATAAPIRNEMGAVAAGIVVFSDITEHKQLEVDLREKSEELSRYFASSLDLLCIANLEGHFLRLNPEWEKVLGYSLAELEGRLFLDLVHPDDMESTLSAISKLGAQEQVVSFVNRYLCKDGSFRWIEWRSQPQGDLIYAAARDITETILTEKEKSNLEAQLQQAQKMESVGRLAGGVAHDFNNMLTVILGHTQLALMDTKLTDPLKNHLEEIRIAADRSADLTRQLLAFARKQTIDPKVLDLNEVVSGMLKMLQRLIGEGVNLNWHPASNLWNVEVDPSQINQILANLCVNARDSISNIGKITIETDNNVIDDEYCANHAGFTVGEYVRLSVSDNGSGMSKETLSQIFEPFFTTKGLGEGTGLGLATVYGIVKQNKGFINVYSEPGLGTTFTIYLPRYVGSAQKINSKETIKPARQGQETILLVEDEQAILNITQMVLSKQGYNVLAANSPLEAIRFAGEHTSEIHLLMTDVVMPEMNGRDLAKKLQTLYPDLKCLYMSGYTANVIAHHGVLDTGLHFIQKPFNLNTLADKLREVFES
ncbi:MAG: PAS domain S-box protein [Desulfuromonadales bacterium]